MQFPSEVMQLTQDWVNRKYPELRGLEPTARDYLAVMCAAGTNAQWRGLIQANPQRRRELYRAYVVSAAWHRKRTACIDAADGCCVRCGGPAVQAHHLTYDRLGDELPEDLQAICVRCHRGTHGLPR